MWRQVTIGEICSSVCSGGTPNSKNRTYYENGVIPWLNTKEINFNRIRKTERYITQAGYEASSTNWIPANTVIVAMYGATAAKVAICKIPITTNQACCNLIVDPNKADYRFVYYYLCSQYEHLASHANGAAQQNLNAGQIKQYPIFLPELSIQKKIADMLSCIDDKIENNHAINDNLEQQAQTYFQKLFVDSAASERVLGTISDLGTVVGGSTPSKAKSEYYTTNGIAWITPKDLSINTGKFISKGKNDITELGLKNSSASVMPKGTVLFTSRAPIGYIAIASGELTTNQGFKSIIPKPEIGTAFVYYFLKQNLQIIECMSSGSTFKEVSGSTMKSVPVSIPNKESLAQFNCCCDPIFSQQQLLEVQNHWLANLRDFLLPRLMSGELDVSELDI